MKLTLTKWWEAFKTDLERLAPKLLNNQLTQWKIAEDLIKEGLSIETNLSTALAIRNRMDALAKTLNYHYNPESKPTATRFLPGINSPDDFLLALLYCNHLKRYEQITEGNFLVLRGIKQELLLIQEDIKELEQLLAHYVFDEENQKALEKQFSGLENQPGNSHVEQMQQYISAPSLEEKIALILAEEGSGLIESQNLSQPKDIFESCQKMLEEKKVILDEMGYCKELMELLEEETEVPLEDLLKKHNDSAIKCQILWQKLIRQLPLTSFGQYSQAAKRATTQVITSPLRLVSSVTHWVSKKNILPPMMNRAVSGTSAVIDIIDKMVKPLTVDACKKKLLHHLAETHLKELICQFSDDHRLNLTAKEVMEEKASDLSHLAKKLTMRSTLNALQQALEGFEKNHEQGLVRVSLASIFGLLTEFFTKTLLKPLINDTVLLVQTSKKLQENLNIFQKELEVCKSDEEIALVETQVSTVLEKTRQRAQKITGKSLYLFFREEQEKASIELQELVNVSGSVCNRS